MRDVIATNFVSLNRHPFIPCLMNKRVSENGYQENVATWGIHSVNEMRWNEVREVKNKVLERRDIETTSEKDG